MGTELDTTNGNVPELYDPSQSIDADDVEFPRLYIAQGSHGFVQEELVRRGSLLLATSGNDPDPNVLTQPGDEKGINLHVLALRKSKSLTNPETGELVRFDFNDPDVPPQAWTVYHYLIALPGIENDLPVKWILTKSGKPAAQKMNTVIARRGTPLLFQPQFNLTTSERVDQARSYRWHVARIRPSEASDSDLEVAERLFNMAQGVNHRRMVENEPAI